MFLISHINSIDQSYSLIKPLIETRVSEIGNWSIIGSAINLKDKIRITNNLKGLFGQVCHRVPTNFKDWSVDLEFLSTDGVGGSDYIFQYTEQFCPVDPLEISGFKLWINISQTDEKNQSAVYINAANDKSINYTHLVPVHYSKVVDAIEPLRFVVTKKDGKIRVVDSNNIQIYEQDSSNLPDYGYFSFTSDTELDSSNNDLVSFTCTPLSEPTLVDDGTDYSHINRKNIVPTVEIRRERKAQRRKGMPMMLHYNNRTTDKLNPKEPQYLEHSLDLINEAIVRTDKSITLPQLASFISQGVDVMIKSAVRKLMNAGENLDEMENQLTTVWTNLKTELLNLSISSRAELEQIQKEVIEEAKQISLKNPDVFNLQKHVDKISNQPVSYLPAHMFMLITCILEGIAYVIFFMYHWKKSKGFKKYD